MKTYSETKGKKPIDWNARLARSAVSDSTWRRWKKDAESWVTCPCGNQCDVIERNEVGAPKDSKLKRLGIEFMYDIRHKDLPSARQFLAQIEKRSAELINLHYQ